MEANYFTILIGSWTKEGSFLILKFNNLFSKDSSWKTSVLNILNGRLFSYKKEWTFTTGNNLGGFGDYYAKWNVRQKKTNIEWYHLYVEYSEYNWRSVQFSCSVVSDSLRPHELQHARPPCLSPSPGVHSNSCPSSQWCHLAISSSVIPFSSCSQSLPESVFSNESLFAWGGQSTGVSALASFLPRNTQADLL